MKLRASTESDGLPPPTRDWLSRILGKDGTARRLRRGLSWTAVGNLVSSAATLLGTLGLARMLGPRVFGEFAVVQNALGFFILLTGAALDVTATKYVSELRGQDPERLGRVLRLARLVAYGITGVVATGLVVFAPYLAATVLKAPEVAVHLRVASVALLMMMLNGVQVGILAGFEAFRSVAIVNVLRGAVTLPAFWLGARWQGSLGAVWGLALAWSVACLSSGLLVRETLHKNGVPGRARGFWSERGFLLGFSFPSWVGALLVGGANWIASVFVTRQPDGLEQSGVVNAANQLFLLLMFLPQIVNQAGLPILMERATSAEPEGAAAILRRLRFLNLLVSVPGSLMVGLASPFLMGRFGPGFGPHWPVLAVTVATVPLYAVGQPGINLAVARGRVWAAARIHAVYLVTFVGAAWWWREMGAMGFALARLLTFVVFAFLAHRVTRSVWTPPCDSGIQTR